LPFPPYSQAHTKRNRIEVTNMISGRILRKALVPGAAASILSAISLAILGKSELNRSAAPVNGPSQWVWGRHAPFENGLSLKYTMLGYAIHHATSVF
jgi:hypothetical protein